MTFRKFGEQIAGWNLALDKVVCDDRMDHILRSPLGHVAGKAIGVIRMLARGDQRAECGLMAAQALGGEVRGARFPGRQALVRVVASQAGQRAFALHKAAGLPQAIGGAGNFKLVIVTLARRIVKVEDKVLQRLTRNIRLGRPVESPNQGRDAATGWLQMALHAGLHL